MKIPDDWKKYNIGDIVVLSDTRTYFGQDKIEFKDAIGIITDIDTIYCGYYIVVCGSDNNKSVWFQYESVIDRIYKSEK